MKDFQIVLAPISKIEQSEKYIKESKPIYDTAFELIKKGQRQEAETLLKTLADNGHHYALNYLAYTNYIWGGKNNPAIDMWQKAAELGNPYALKHLRWYYSDRKNTEPFTRRNLEGDTYFIDDEVSKKYTAMFNQPFQDVQYEGEICIAGRNVKEYIFDVKNYDFTNIGGFYYLFVVTMDNNTKRYFALERTYGGDFALCEWVFDKKTKKHRHDNYGTIVYDIYNPDVGSIACEKIGEILNNSQ